jgi:tetratricopeptide (TPR) repeat protein
LFEDKGDLQKAIANLQTATRYSPAYAPGLYALGELYAVHNMRYGDIIRLRRQIALYDPEFYEEYYIGKAFKQIYEQKYEGAIQTIQALIEITPEKEELYCFLANAHLALGQLNEAEAALMALARVNASSPELNKYLVSLYVKRGDYTRAIDYTERVLRTKPGDADLFETIQIVCLEKLGRASEAESAKKRLLEDKKREHLLVNNFGDVYYNFFDEPDKAIPYYERRIGMQPAPFERVYFIVAKYYFKKDDLEKAKEYAEKGLETYPQYERLIALKEQINNKVASPESQ